MNNEPILRQALSFFTFGLVATTSCSQSDASQAQAEAEVGTASSTKQNKPVSTLSPQELHQRTVALAQSQIDLVKQMAQAAEKNNSPDAYKQWLLLADCEARAEHPTEAVDHVKYAIKLYRRSGDTWDFPDVFVPANPLCSDLAKQGRVAEAENLLAEALKIMQSSFGPQSAAAANQLSQTAMFYFDQQKPDQGFKALDELLQIGPRVIEVAPFPGDCSLKHILNYTYVLESDRKNQSGLALKILQTILDAQRKSLESDDQRIANTLLQLSAIEMRMNRNEDAEKHALEAVRIYKLHVGDLRLQSATFSILPQLWKKMGRTADAQEINVRPIGMVSPALMRKIGAERDAEQIEKYKKLPADYIDTTNPSEQDRVVFDEKATPEIQIEQLKKEYSDARLQAPYSARAKQALDALMSVALAAKNWNVLAEAGVARCKIYEHEPDENAGRSIDLGLNCNERMRFYGNVVKAFIEMGKVGEAQKWLDRAIEVFPEKSCLEYITVAQLELVCANPVLAAKYADFSEKSFSPQYLATYPDVAAEVWNKLGQPERAKAIAAKRDELQKSQNKTGN